MVRSGTTVVVVVIALLYLALGVAGFVGHGEGMGPDDGRSVWLFGTSALTDMVHVGVGALGLISARAARTRRAYGWFLFFGFAGLTAYAVLDAAIGGGELANMTSANAVLYGITSAAGLVLALHRTRTDRATPVP